MASAKTGATWIAVVVIGVAGYASALGLAVTAILKLVIPARIGLWLGPHSLSFGMTGDPGARELLGDSYAWIAAALAVVIGGSTTEALRALMRGRGSAAGRPSSRDGGRSTGR